MEFHRPTRRAVTTMFVSALGGFGLFPRARAAAEQQRQLVVEIRDFVFEPARLETAPGDRVTWINRDIVPHTVTALDESWDSGQLDKGEMWSITLQAGTSAEYFCRFHPMMRAALEIAARREPGRPLSDSS